VYSHPGDSSCQTNVGNVLLHKKGKHIKKSKLYSEYNFNVLLGVTFLSKAPEARLTGDIFEITPLLLHNCYKPSMFSTENLLRLD
jgi:hypothetical protein